MNQGFLPVLYSLLFYWDKILADLVLLGLQACITMVIFSVWDSLKVGQRYNSELVL